MQALEGSLERITYYNDSTMFMVARLRGNDDVLYTIIGNMPRFSAGERLRLQGDWRHHSEYGRQFQVSGYEIAMPHNILGIQRFLSSGLIKGVGPATAEKIVERFGMEALDVIEHNPIKLTEIEGIGEKKAAMIGASLQERLEVMNVMAFLQSYGVSTGYAGRIYKKYGDETVKVVSENPYRLAEDVFGIGFRTADKVALEMGISPDSPERIRAAILFLLNKAQDEGHIYLPQAELIKRIMTALTAEDSTLSHESVEQQLGRLMREGQLVFDAEAEDAVYLAPLYYAELYTAKRLREIAEFPPAYNNLELPSLENSEHSLAPEQREAVHSAINTGLLVVTGGPGTGKTTTICSLLSLFLGMGLEVMLAAPTGRAAKRMTEATGVEAKTIHRLLEFTNIEGKGYRFQRDEDRPLKAHVVIVDEMSMVDQALFYHLLKAIPSGCKLILVGDMDQLPSVGPGNILRDIISSGAVPVARLKQIFRQAGQSAIIANAHLVNTGQMPQLKDAANDFYFLNESEPEKILEKILDLCSRRLPEYKNKDAINDIQVLSPMRRNTLGVENLNLLLQRELNPAASHKPEMRSRNVVFRLGDKVMQIKNNYQKEVYNGDIGRITHINREDGEINVLFPDVGGAREVVYDQAELDELVLSYAVSVHKSQGSEYPIVVIPVVTQHYILLQRNLLYTAITRAKELVVLIGTKKALAIAVRNNKVEERYTRLAARLAAEAL